MFLVLNLSSTKFSLNVFFVSQKLFFHMPAGGAIMSEPTFSPKKTNASTDDSGDDDDGKSITKNKGELSSATGHATCLDGTTDKSPSSCEMQSQGENLKVKPLPTKRKRRKPTKKDKKKQRERMREH